MKIFTIFYNLCTHGSERPVTKNHGKSNMGPASISKPTSHNQNSVSMSRRSHKQNLITEYKTDWAKHIKSETKMKTYI